MLAFINRSLFFVFLFLFLMSFSDYPHVVNILYAFLVLLFANVCYFTLLLILAIFPLFYDLVYFYRFCNLKIHSHIHTYEHNMFVYISFLFEVIKVAKFYMRLVFFYPKRIQRNTN